MGNPEIKLCPFCGGKAKLSDHLPLYDDDPGDNFVICVECRIQVPACDMPNVPVENAIAAWNRRAVEAASPAAPGLEAVLREVTEWQMQQFPHRTAHSIATHLLEEAQELHHTPTDAEEMADVCMLLAGLAHFNGVNLAEVVRAKLAKNKARNWGKPDEDGVVRHVEGPHAPALDAPAGE